MGGATDGPCYQATIVTDVPPGTELAESETFGPVVAIEIVDDDESAVERANATPMVSAPGSSRPTVVVALTWPAGSRLESST